MFDEEGGLRRYVEVDSILRDCIGRREELGTVAVLSPFLSNYLLATLVSLLNTILNLDLSQTNVSLPPNFEKILPSLSIPLRILSATYFTRIRRRLTVAGKSIWHSRQGSTNAESSFTPINRVPFTTMTTQDFYALKA